MQIGGSLNVRVNFLKAISKKSLIDLDLNKI